MTKKTKGIIIGGSAAVILLAGALVALKLTEPASEEEDNLASTSDSASSSESRLLYDKNPSDIAKVTITNEKGTLDVERYADDFWTIPDVSGLPLNYTAIQGIIDECASVTAKQTVVESADDISIYGLDSPTITAEITFDGTNASEKKLIIGDETPKSGSYYFMIEGDETVYTIASSAITYLSYDEFDCINKVLYADVTDDDTEDDYDPKKINSIVISRKDIDYDIRLIYDVRQDDENAITGNSSTHIMVDPVELDLNPDNCDSVLNGVFGLTADGVAVAAPTDEQLEEYGLKDPFGTVDFDINAGAFKLYIGNPVYDENNKKTGYYCMADGVDIIYTLNTDNIPWAEVMPMDITMTMVTSNYIYSVTALDLDVEGSKTHVDVESDEDNNLTLTMDGTAYEDVAKFKTFYQYILRAPAEELYLEENNEPARITLTITTEYGEDVIEFITAENRMTVIRLNGRTSFRCRTSYVDRLAENIENLKNGNDIIESW